MIAEDVNNLIKSLLKLRQEWEELLQYPPFSMDIKKHSEYGNFSKTIDANLMDLSVSMRPEEKEQPSSVTKIIKTLETLVEEKDKSLPSSVRTDMREARRLKFKYKNPLKAAQAVAKDYGYDPETVMVY